MKPNNPLLILFLGLIIFLLVGCQQALDLFPFLRPVGDIASVTTGTPPVTTPTGVITPEVIIPLDREITLWLPPQFDPENGSPAGNLLKAHLAQYTIEHPDVTLKVRIKAVSGTGGLLDTLQTASAAAPAVLPGIIFLPRTDFEKAVDQSLLQAVEMDPQSLNFEEWFPFSQELVKVDGKSYGLPMGGDVLVLSYKTSMINYPPNYWSEIIEEQFTLTFPASDPSGLTALLLYINAEGTFEEDAGELTMQEYSLLRGLQVLHEGALKNVFPYWLTDQKTFEDSWNSFQNSNAAYALSWLSQVYTARLENTAFTQIPAISEPSLTLADGWILAFPQAPPERYREYMSLALYMLDPLFQQSWSEAVGLIPADRSSLSGWKDELSSGILMDIADSAHVIPGRLIIDQVGFLFSEATVNLVQKQTGYTEASNAILNKLAE